MSLSFALQRPEALWLLAAVAIVVALEILFSRARARVLAVFGGARFVSRSPLRSRSRWRWSGPA
jgi:hypothetical protein